MLRWCTVRGKSSFVALTMMCVLGCKTVGSRVAASDYGAADSNDFVTKATAGSKDLLAKCNPYPVQSDPGDEPTDCRTLIVPADPSVPFKGTAVFFHGFSACPNQFIELAHILAKKGVNSFAPLMPGQGRAPVPVPSTGKTVAGKSLANYYGEYLPEIRSQGVKRYEDFVHDVNQLVQSFNGHKMVMGLSVGGALATFAYLDQPGLYQRALLTSPFYGAPGKYETAPTKSTFVRTIKRILDRFLYRFENTDLVVLAADMSLVGNRPMAWSDNCFVQNAGEPGKAARRGFCNFKLGNLAAVIGFGDDIFRRIRALPTGAALPQVQYIFSEFDTGAGTIQMRRLAAFQQLVSAPDQVNICAHPHEVGHSFFSRPDFYHSVSDPYWLNGFLQMATDFIADGTPYKVDAEQASLERVYDAKTDKDGGDFLRRCTIVRDQTVPHSEGEATEQGTQATPTEQGTQTAPTEQGTQTAPTEPGTQTAPTEQGTQTAPTEQGTQAAPTEPGT